jgi:putative transposase
MKRLWLSSEELTKVTGWSPRTVRRKVEKNEMFQRDRKGHGKDSSVREYSTNNLSPAQQVKAEKMVAARNKTRKSSAFDNESNSTQLALFSTPSSNVSSIPIPVKPAQKEQIEKGFKSIEALAEILDLPESQRFPHRMPDGTRVRNWSEADAWSAKQDGSSISTIQRRKNRFKKEGRRGLLRVVRRDKHSSHFFDAHREAAYLAAYIFLECRQSCRAAYEAIVRNAAMIEVPSEELPSYETVRAWLRSIPPSLTVYAREGRKAYQDKMSPFLQRQFTDVYANDVWIGDVAILDMEAQNDVFENVEYGAPLRIRLDANIDYRSRLVVGYSFCWEGSSRSVAATMMRGIRKYGPPVYWYTDNGKPQKKAALGAVPGCHVSQAPQNWRKAEIESIEATGFLARAGIAIQHCLPFHPQAKAIERWFRTVHERFDKCWPTYTSGNPFTRPDSTTALMLRHRSLVKHGRLAESDHPKVSTIIAAFVGWAEEYNNTPHSGTGNDGSTPREVFDANRNPQQRPAPDAATLALLMAEHERRQVRECAVTLNKRRYVPIDPDGYATLHNLNQTEILIAYEPGVPETAAALDEDGNFLCALQAEELVHFAPGDPYTQNIVRESMRQRRHLEKKTREVLSTISLIARSNGAQSPLEAMAKRLQLPAGETGADLVTQRKPRTDPDGYIIENMLIPGQGPDRLAARLSARPPTPAEVARIVLAHMKIRKTKEEADSEFQYKEATG